MSTGPSKNEKLTIGQAIQYTQELDTLRKEIPLEPLNSQLVEWAAYAYLNLHRFLVKNPRHYARSKSNCLASIELFEKLVKHYPDNLSYHLGYGQALATFTRKDPDKSHLPDAIKHLNLVYDGAASPSAKQKAELSLFTLTHSLPVKLLTRDSASWAIKAAIHISSLPGSDTRLIIKRLEDVGSSATLHSSCRSDAYEAITKIIEARPVGLDSPNILTRHLELAKYYAQAVNAKLDRQHKNRFWQEGSHLGGQLERLTNQRYHLQQALAMPGLTPHEQANSLRYLAKCLKRISKCPEHQEDFFLQLDLLWMAVEHSIFIVENNLPPDNGDRIKDLRSIYFYCGLVTHLTNVHLPSEHTALLSMRIQWLRKVVGAKQKCIEYTRQQGYQESIHCGVNSPLVTDIVNLAYACHQMVNTFFEDRKPHGMRFEDYWDHHFEKGALEDMLHYRLKAQELLLSLEHKDPVEFSKHQKTIDYINSFNTRLAKHLGVSLPSCSLAPHSRVTNLPSLHLSSAIML